MERRHPRGRSTQTLRLPSRQTGGRLGGERQSRARDGPAKPDDGYAWRHSSGPPNRLGEVRKPVGSVAVFANSARSTVVMNNAGHSLFGAVKSLTDEQSSIRSVQTCSAQSRRCAPPFRICASKGRRIIQLSTYGVQGIFPGGSLYHASKWGVEGFFDSVMQELGPSTSGSPSWYPPAVGTNLHFGVAQVGRKLDANAGTATSMVHPILEDSSFR